MTFSIAFKAACLRASFLRVTAFDFRFISHNSRKDRPFAVNCTRCLYHTSILC